MKTTALLHQLRQLKDNRRKQGTRHSQANILLLVILATMSGYHGYRSIEDFCIRYSAELKEALGHPKHGLPSYSSIRRVIMSLDFNTLSTILSKWIGTRVELEKKEWMQIDGKGIKGTMMDYSSKEQRFLQLVSLFADRLGITLAARQMSNKDNSEIAVVRQLISELKIKDVILSMDALHCQKKRWSRLFSRVLIMW